MDIIIKKNCGVVYSDEAFEGLKAQIKQKISDKTLIGYLTVSDFPALSDAAALAKSFVDNGDEIIISFEPLKNDKGNYFAISNETLNPIIEGYGVRFFEKIQDIDFRSIFFRKKDIIG